MKNILSGIQEVIKERSEGKILTSENPMPALIEKGLAVSTGNGLFVLKGPLVKVLGVIESVFSSLAWAVSAEEIHVPIALSVSNLKRSKYLDSFGNQAQALRLGTSLEPGSGELVGLACPTVCYHYFSSLAKKTVSSDHLVTALGRCSRHEEGRLEDLSRLSNFTMREIIGFGSAEYCSSQFQGILARTKQILQDVFDLSFSVQTASDPFFGNNYELKKKAQLLEESKYELRAELPYNQNTLSVASFNRHRGVFLERFSISAAESSVNESF